jgi:hypothetical protein
MELHAIKNDDGRLVLTQKQWVKISPPTQKNQKSQENFHLTTISIVYR